MTTIRGNLSPFLGNDLGSSSLPWPRPKTKISLSLSGFLQYWNLRNCYWYKALDLPVR